MNHKLFTAASTVAILAFAGQAQADTFNLRIGAGHPVGQLGCALLAAALNSEKDQTHCASGNDQDHDHCDDDGGHDFPFRQSMEIPAWGRNCLTGARRVCDGRGDLGTALGS